MGDRFDSATNWFPAGSVLTADAPHAATVLQVKAPLRARRLRHPAAQRSAEQRQCIVHLGEAVPAAAVATPRASTSDTNGSAYGTLPGTERRQCWSPPVDAGGRDSSASDVIASVPRAASSSTSVASSPERA